MISWFSNNVISDKWHILCTAIESQGSRSGSCNMGTLVAALIVIAILCAAVVAIVKDKKKGKSSCGCNCAHCATGGSCRGT